MMKKISKLLAAILSVFMICSVMMASATAEQYYYTITLSSGDANASVENVTVDVTSSTATVTKTAEKVTISNLAYGDHVTIDASSAAFDKYYVTGIKKAGQDALSNPGITVTEDASYVVGYGMMGDMVNYTVKYVDKDGNEIATADTFKGKAGDKPIVSAKYIEGYTVTNAYNITGTISEGTEFTFIYTTQYEWVTVRYVDGGTTVISIGGNTAGGTTGGNRGGTTGETTGGEEENGESSESSENSEVTPDQGSSETEEPAEIIDIDEEETPLAPGGNSTTNTAAIVGGGVGFVGLLAVILLLLKKKKNDKEETNE